MLAGSPTDEGKSNSVREESQSQRADDKSAERQSPKNKTQKTMLQRLWSPIRRNVWEPAKLGLFSVSSELKRERFPKTRARMHEGYETLKNKMPTQESIKTTLRNMFPFKRRQRGKDNDVVESTQNEAEGANPSDNTVTTTDEEEIDTFMGKKNEKKQKKKLSYSSIFDRRFRNMFGTRRIGQYEKYENTSFDDASTKSTIQNPPPG
jgi:hypothetical protein